jgi:adenylate cyclase
VSDPDIKRRLAAILSADVAGYSRLMGTDEEATLATLGAWREVFDRLIARHDGRFVGSAGDSVLAEFASPVEATRCAVAVQHELAARNDELAEERRMRFRIGINLGDVMAKGGDLFGDGVNVAARLEALAEPGGICISGAVYDQVHGKLDLDFRDLGPQSVKNIAEPVRVYRIGGDMSEAPPAGDGPPLPDKPSVAVLPFNNMSADPEQEYFSDGISEDIITDLSKVSGLFVIARNSSFAYKGRSPNISDVSRELGVRFVLEGSVRKAANRVRINAQLIDGPTGGHLWAERFDRDLTDIFAVQDEVTQEIVKALKVTLTEDERARLSGRDKVNPEAYDCLVRGRDLMMQFTAEATNEACACFDKAIELEPGLAISYAGLSLAASGRYVNLWDNDAEAELAKSLDLANKAVDVDATEPMAHFALAVAEMWQKNLEAAERAAMKSLELDPNLAEGYGVLGRIRDYLGRPQEALEIFERVTRLNPFFPDLLLQFIGHAQFMLQRWDEAEATFKRRLLRRPQSDVTRVFLASVYGHTGRPDEARAMWAEALEANPRYSLERMRRVLPYKDPERFELVVHGLRKAGVVS